MLNQSHFRYCNALKTYRIIINTKGWGEFGSSQFEEIDYRITMDVNEHKELFTKRSRFSL